MRLQQGFPSPAHTFIMVYPTKDPGAPLIKAPINRVVEPGDFRNDRLAPLVSSAERLANASVSFFCIRKAVDKGNLGEGRMDSFIGWKASCSPVKLATEKSR